VRRFIARRLTEDIEKAPGPVNALVKTMKGQTPFQLEVLSGMSDALRGWRKARAPEAWAGLQKTLSASPSKQVRELGRDLSVVFGDGRALAELRQIALNSSADGEARRSALRVLIENRPKDLLPLLQKLVNDRATVAVAVGGLAAFDDPDTPKLILNHYHLLNPEDRPEAVNTLVSPPGYPAAPLTAAATGTCARSWVSRSPA